MENSLCKLLGIKLPIIQAGMVWVSGWRLAATVSNSGGLGVIGAGSMHPEMLLDHIRSFRAVSQATFAVNVPLMYPEIDRIMEILIKEKVPVVITSAGNPKLWTEKLKKSGAKVLHVVSSVKFALKAEQAGADAIIAEGFEAGGHNGREETTTFCLIPEVAKAVKVPVVAAGGVGSGKSILAAMALGASGVQVGTLFAVAEESSAHHNYKQQMVEATEGATVLTLKSVSPTRMLKNAFYQSVKQMEETGASGEVIREHLGRGRAKKGIFEGDLTEGELEIGQIVSSVDRIRPAKEILEQLWEEFLAERKLLVEALADEQL